MANNFTFEQAATLLNSLAAQVTGRSDLVATDVSSFVSVAQTTLLTGTDPLAMGISQVLDRTLFSARPYYAKFQSMERSAGEFGAWERKINYIDGEFMDDAAFPLTDGQSVDMYTVRKPKVLQLNFYGQNVVSDCITRSLDQLKVAFRGPDEFSEFFAGAMQNLSDRHEQKAENVARINIMNLVLGIKGLAGNNATPQIVHLLTEYNALTGGSYTATSIMTAENYNPFMRWVYARIKTARDRLTDRTTIYHANVTNKAIARHTPYDKQILYMYAPELRQMEARVLADAFHDERLEYNAVELVNYWQAISDPMKISGKPTYMGTDGALVVPQAASAVDKLLAVLVDYEALGVRRYSEGMYSTPLNARGRYYNMFYHWRFRNWVDYTENAVLFFLD